MEDEDYFEFSDDILIASTEKLQFRDTAIYINSSADGQLDLVADTEIQIAATTIDINGLVDISGNLSVGGNLDVTGTFDLSDSNFTNAGNIQLDSISGDGDTDTSITFSGSDVITVANAGTNQVTFNDGSIAPVTDSDVDLGTNSLRFKDVYVDSITATDQITATGFTGTLDGILGSGSAAAATVTTLDTSGAVNLNLVTDSTSSTSGALIVDGGVGIAKKLYVGTDLDVDGTTNLDVVDIDGAVDMASTLAVAGVLTGASLDISGDIDIDGTANLDIVDIDGAVDMASTLQVDGVATFTGRDIHSGGITIANAGQIGSVGDTDAIAIASDGVVTLTQKLVGTELDISGNVDVDGTTNLDVVDIDGAVDMATTLAVAGNVDFNGDLDVDGTTNLDNTDIDGTLVVDGSNISLDSTSTLNIDNSNTTNGITIGTATSGVPVSIGHTTSEVTFGDNVTVTGDFTVNGTTTTVATTNMVVADNLIELNNGATSNANDSGIVIERGSTGDNAIFMWDESADTFVLGTTTATGASTGNLSVTDGALQAGSLDISGDIDVDGTTNLDVVDIDGAVDFASTTAHAGNATFADNAKAIFGAGSDLQIYHNGSASFVQENGTGSLNLCGTNIFFKNGDNTETYAGFTNNGAVELRYDNAAKLATTATGIDVTGITVSDGMSTNTSGTSNFRAGVNAGNSIESGGNYNTVVGDEAGTAITTGDYNTAVGKKRRCSSNHRRTKHFYWWSCR